MSALPGEGVQGQLDGELDPATEFQELFDRAQFSTIIEAASTRRSLSRIEERILGESLAALELLRQLNLEAAPIIEDAISNRVMCILHASRPYQSGGYAVRAHGILSTLGDEWDMWPVTRPGFPSESLSTERAVAVDSVRYRHLDNTVYPRKHGEMRYMLASVQRYEDEMRRIRPSIVHLRSTYLVALPGLIAARRLGIPTVYEVSGLWELVYGGRPDQLGMKGRAKRSTWLESLVMREVDRSVTLTGRMREILIERGAPAKHVAISPNAVNARDFDLDPPGVAAYDRYGISPHTPTVGYIGSFVDYEGLDLLIESFHLLASRGVRFQAILVGDGAEFERIESLVSERGLGRQVVLTGRLPHTDVAQIYSLVDVCAFPRHSTPATEAVSPLKPFEALASGKPVVVSGVSALQDIVQDGSTGFIMREHTAEELSRLLKSLLESEELRCRLGSHGSEWVRTERSWAKSVAPIRQWYSELSNRVC